MITLRCNSPSPARTCPTPKPSVSMKVSVAACNYLSERYVDVADDRLASIEYYVQHAFTSPIFLNIAIISTNNSTVIAALSRSNARSVSSAGRCLASSSRTITPDHDAAAHGHAKEWMEGIGMDKRWIGNDIRYSTLANLCCC